MSASRFTFKAVGVYGKELGFRGLGFGFAIICRLLLGVGVTDRTAALVL